MANLPTKTFAQIVSDQVTYIQGAATALIDFAIGSILRSIAEANATVVLWFQGMLLSLLATTRAATSSGTDLDSWCADYNFYRLPAVAASGAVTFARFSANLAAFIPVGTTIQTSDTTPELFTVTADPNNARWNAVRNGYDVPGGVMSVVVPVVATVAGSAGNVLAGQCNVLTQSIPGIDTVYNALAFTNGLDAENDDAFRNRFVVYLGSLAKGTKLAIMNAVSALGANVYCTVTENLSYAGAPQPGYFYVVVDDGSGNPPSPLLSSASNAIDLARPFTVAFGVFAPVQVTATIVMVITTASGYTHSAVVAQVQAALQTYVNSLKLGQSLPYFRLAQIALDASPGVTNVTSAALNGGTSDLTATAQQVIKTGVPAVS